MPEKYIFTARDYNGDKIRDVLTASNRNEALEILNSQGLVPVSLGKKNYLLQIFKDRLIEILKSMGYRPYSSRELMVFCRQFATMLYSGVSILQGLEILAGQTRSSAFKKQIKAVALEVEEGSTLAGAMHKQGDFPSVMVSMIETGESSGKLDLIMENLADHFEKQHDFHEKIRSATFYPLFIIGASLAVMLVMVLYVLPQFAQVFESLGMEMPVYTRMLFKASALFRQYYLLLLLCGVFVLTALIRYFKTTKGRLQYDYLRLRFPFFGNIYTQALAARFARTMSTLLNGGTTLHAALHLADKVTANVVISKSIGELSEALNRGEAMAGLVKDIKPFPVLLSEMIRVGEETGTLDQTLNRSAVFYEREVAYIVERLSTILEPVLLLLVGIFIGVLVFSILSPMYQVFQMI